MKGYRMILLLLVMLLLIIVGCSKKEEPSEVLDDYLSNWENKDFSAMYEQLSDEVKNKITEEAFIERYENIYDGIEAENLQVTSQVDSKEQLESDGGVMTLPYKVEMNTAAGPIEYRHRLTLEQGDEGAWLVKWNTSQIFPQLSTGDKVKVNTLEAERGELQDKNGNGLAVNDDANVIGVIPGMLEEGTQTKEKLAELLDISVEEINQALDASWVTPEVFVPIKTLPMEEDDIEAYVELPGVSSRVETVRTYPLGASTAHLAGYVREISAEQLGKLDGYAAGDVIGNAGLEKVFEDKLRGEKGAHIYISNADGDVKETLAKKEPVDGEDVQLTIDAALQQEIYNQFDGDAGTSIALDPNSGKVLSLVSSPSYNPNAFVRGLSDEQWEKWSEDPDEPFLNRFISRYAPGSVFKTITASIGLETGITNPEKVRQIDGLHWTKDDSWGDYYVTRVHDKADVNLRDAFIHSDNIYFAQEALEMGKDSFLEEAAAFGFGEEIPFPFAIPASNLTNNGEIEHEVQLADTAYGQGQVMMSPLHLALTYTPYLNEGNMLYPSLVEADEPEVWKENLISEETADLVKENLIQVVESPDGTAHSTYIPEAVIGGKSGTAEIKGSKEDDNGNENGWFVGFEEDDSDILLVMMVEDVKDRGGSGYVISKARSIFEYMQ
ncbi:penicillin-binding protein 3 [Oceanobacillus oncorhynchi subsp. incaldanensis]|uniref:serine-type D-Ala-D-Ala carboxypeptidase n=1 Tax=Oceanobacillus oncorhynchi TaxID=545501 RepID=A0A0A1M9A7_9BACI|nr:penicillin-binding transpeptidase domain-containing protein [Oceanobacillus oncorhynchi]GIO18568.1 penicillin-binding protein 3 [Oceanobacillus oncorhynchi subsp. incaldanensis]CEI81920.1 Beta-lactam-inducible penicillin-binding protein [Oceanobacillus oncorhynchi]